jgi:arylformamidase
MTEYRAHFDATVEFSNGGGLTATSFRLDLPDINADVAELFIRHLGLALVSDVTLANLEIVEEQHRGSRGVDAPAPAVRSVVDLSHTIFDGLVTYPGLPAPVITPHLTREASVATYAPGTTFAMDIITMIGNTGTYLDSPFHRYEGGTDLAGLDLATLVDQPAEVFHLHDATQRGIPASVFFDRDVRGKAVLLHTGWDSRFGTPDYATDAPFLSEAGTRYLVEQGVTIVGIDSLNIDDTSKDAAGRRPAHSLLLEAGVHVVEHLTNLGALPPTGARFTAAPPKVAGFGTFPVRAFATLG